MKGSVNPRRGCSEDPERISARGQELYNKVCLYLCKKSQLKFTLLFELHASPTTGHLGFTKNNEWVRRSFFWDGMK
jgi:hypothetical protein